MFCILHRWFISRSMDTVKPLPWVVDWHVRRCRECAHFRQQCLGMAERLSDEACLDDFSVSPELRAKILRRCRPTPKSSGESTTPARRLHLRRSAVAWTAAAMVMLAVGVFLYSRFQATPQNTHPINGQGAEPPAWLFTASPLSAVSDSASVVENALRRPAENEIRLLRQDGKAAAEFILACIPLDLDPRGKELSPPTQPARNGG